MEGPEHDIVPPEAVLARIEAARADAAARGHAPPALATDADGTLWDGDVGIDLFEALLAARGARPEALAALRGEADAAGIHLPAGADAHAAAAALYEAFQAERYAEDRAFAMMAWVFAGWSEDDLSAFVDGVLEQQRIEDRYRPGLLSILDWARAQEIEVIVVSASPRMIVERAVARIGIPAGRVLAMTPRIEGGRVAPELGAPATYGDGKVRALQRERPGLDLLAAFGDSAYDAPLLRAARVPVAVTPSAKLLALAPTIPGLLVMGR
jgi:HAD superfamily phosphoserine phosphatase-like hydrolase